MQYEALRAKWKAVIERDLRDLYAAQLVTLLRYYRISIREFFVRTELRVVEFLYLVLKPSPPTGNDIAKCSHDSPEDKPNDPVQPPARNEPEKLCQTSTRVGWNGGLGGWARRQCRNFMDFALFIHSAQYAEYRYCALPR